MPWEGPRLRAFCEGGKGRTSQEDPSWGTFPAQACSALNFTPFCHLQVAIKIIDKTQLNPSSLQKVRPRERERGRGEVGKRVLKTAHSHLSLSSFQLFREVRIMKGLNHPNIGKKGKGVGAEAARWGTGTGESGTWGLAVITVRPVFS